ncbi:hypothetical protein BDW02DRAFT_536899 [Decorospora gaudefroyi]|uniref:Uncharacterized protein n=1 Tax=Decorospora gaudefroyi TaxID=184978 RepID=A0A6A5K6V9_9PLEO|nr:hypothetical protein BDW02DRAFT_536899 [Decorospora gaudefroyi]
MEQQDLSSFISFPVDTVPPEAPQLRLTLHAPPKLSLSLPYQIQFTISRESSSQEKPVLFKWHPQRDFFTPSGVALVRHTETGFDPIDIDHSALRNDGAQVVKKGRDQDDVLELAPGGSVEMLQVLPARYHEVLVSGQRYTLLWPGGTIGFGDWGTTEEHLGAGGIDKDTRIVLPGGPSIIFTAHAEQEAWPQRGEREASVGFLQSNIEEEEWRRLQIPGNIARKDSSQRESQAPPKLNVTLDCAPTVRRGADFSIMVKVAYEAEADARPIMFHTDIWRDKYTIYRLQDGHWQPWDDDKSGCCGFLIVDEPDVPVHVSRDEHFTSLKPGEEWVTWKCLQKVAWTELPEDAEAGEALRVAFLGGEVSWWAYGGREEHEGTVVKLPCFLWGRVQDPKDNGGRPKLVVPASSMIEFRVED